MEQEADLTRHKVELQATFQQKKKMPSGEEHFLSMSKACEEALDELMV